MLHRDKYLQYDEHFMETEDYSWDFLLTCFMKDKKYNGIYPEIPRLMHIGLKGTTANSFSNKRNELLSYTGYEAVFLRF